MVSLIESKLSKDNLEMTKSLFDYSKMFMHSEQHMKVLEG